MVDGIKGSFDSFRVEEAYNWRDDIMEITRRIIHETDEARLNNIAEHFDVDLSEIREFIESKREKMQKPQTNADRIRAMTDEKLAEHFTQFYYDGPKFYCPAVADVGEGTCAANYDCRQCWLGWLKQEAEEE